MLSVRLIRRLLKQCLCRALEVLTRISTSSVQRLHTLLFCFQRFVAKIRGLPIGHSHGTATDSRSFKSAPESYTALTGATGSTASGWCSQARTPPLPLHNGHITFVTAANSSSQDVALSSQPPTTMPVAGPSILQQAISPRTSSVYHDAEVYNDSNSSLDYRVAFTPVGASNGLRYGNRLHAYVVAAIHHNSA